MHISQGNLRGTPIKGINRAGLRPTTHRVREALFDILLNAKQIDFTDLMILDLFCGTGNFGIEALSLGATRACFVDNSYIQTRILRRNLRELGLLQGVLRSRGTPGLPKLSLPTSEPEPAALHEASSEVFCTGVFRALDVLASRGERFDLIFMDPPYNEDWVNPTLERLLVSGCIKSQTLVIVEHDKRERIQVIPPYWSAHPRRYGDTLLTFLHHKRYA